jgi:TetR/AcrR family transcriptional regulator
VVGTADEGGGGTEAATRAVPRRSDTRTKLLDAAEQLMAEEGYAAVTSRRVGATAGLTSQLVHYYFETMDDLFLEVLRRRADAGLEHLRRVTDASPTLRRLWELRSADDHAVVDIEFVALANHRKSIRDEIASYAERQRGVELEVTERALLDAGISTDEYPPSVVLQAMTGLSQIMVIEKSLGVAAGHDETHRFMAMVFDRLDGGDVRR